MWLGTSFLIAAARAKEGDHQRALAALAEHQGGGLLLPVTILAECMGLIGSRAGLAQQRRLLDGLAASGIGILPADAPLIERSRAIDRAYEDAGFGFADCTLLATCERERVARVLSFDRKLAVYRPSFAPALEVLP